MCNSSPQVMDMLDKTVQQFLSEGRAFTGYDVTIETRTREKIQLRHNDVRGDIHEVASLKDAIDFGYDNGQGVQTWQKTQVPHPQNGQWVFLYHPSSFDPKTFQFRGAQAAPTQAAATAAKAANPTAAASASGAAAAVASGVPSVQNDGASDSGGQSADGSFTTDYRDRLFVPTRFLREAGGKPEATVYVQHDLANSKIVLSLSPVQGLTPLLQQVIERNGDMRLSSKTLQMAGLSGNRYSIENNTNGSTPVVEVATA